MNVWLIKIGEPLPLNDKIRKMRTSFLADSLIARGHKVIWWSSAFEHFKKIWLFEEDRTIDVREGYKIIALRGTGYSKNISLKRILDHRIIARKFKKLSETLPVPDVIVTAMPSYELSYEAVNYGKKHDVPIYVDIRDEWPDIFIKHTFVNRLPLFVQKIVRIVLNSDFHKVKNTMLSAEGICGLSEYFLNWGLSYANRERTWKDKIYYLGYYKNNERMEPSVRLRKLLENIKGKFVTTFIGTFANYHNPEIMVDCAKIMQGSNMVFVLAGDGELFEYIKKRAARLSNIYLTGWLDQDEINTLLNNSHVGLCTTTTNAEAFPNKAFLYLSKGLPIVTLFGGDLKEVVEKKRIGFFSHQGDADGLSRILNQLHENVSLHKEMSENALLVFEEMFDAEKIYTDFALHIEKIVENYRNH